VIWPIYGFKTDYDSVKLQNHRKYVIKRTSQTFSIFKPLR